MSPHPFRLRADEPLITDFVPATLVPMGCSCYFHRMVPHTAFVAALLFSFAACSEEPPSLAEAPTLNELPATTAAEAEPSCAPLRVSIDGTNTPLSHGLAVENRFGLEVLLFNNNRMTCAEILGGLWASPPGQVHVAVRAQEGIGQASTDERHAEVAVRTMGAVGDVGSTVSLCLDDEVTFAPSNGKQPAVVISGRFDGTFCGRAP
ncbi:MAG: hypothetical protein ACI9KE_002863 [Polyangiales bacterium]|jgi:hypothetical protein